LLRKGDVDGAIAEKRMAIRLAPNDASAHENLGAALADKGDINGAIEEFRSATKGVEGQTALMLAARGGHAAVVDALLAAKADVNAKTKNGITALIKAAEGGHAQVVKTLLAAGADANAKQSDGVT